MISMDRFWAKVKRGPTVGCWLWEAALFSKTGYGAFGLRGKLVGAHRMAWKLTHGEIPPGMFVCHRCDNPRCVNPSHLFLGTPRDNSRDMAKKGRGGRPVKLNFEQASRLRREGLSGAEIARRLGVTTGCVNQFLAGQRRVKPG